ncbi:hypothetical protein T01_8289 [Trichinella spiralis]|uniref:Uncharacterized protein n=1 Tax=Trichinella spiralis TaxID=6334 RepID=A0A0V1BM84_TRISP|nr:hypothetical protein T01_8289 [Trichinella spiralis]
MLILSYDEIETSCILWSNAKFLTIEEKPLFCFWDFFKLKFHNFIRALRFIENVEFHRFTRCTLKRNEQFKKIFSQQVGFTVERCAISARQVESSSKAGATTVISKSQLNF